MIGVKRGTRKQMVKMASVSMVLENLVPGRAQSLGFSALRNHQTSETGTKHVNGEESRSPQTP